MGRVTSYLGGEIKGDGGTTVVYPLLCLEPYFAVCQTRFLEREIKGSSIGTPSVIGRDVELQE